MRHSNGRTVHTRRAMLKAAAAAAVGARWSALDVQSAEPAAPTRARAGDGETFSFIVMADPQLFGWPKKDPVGKWRLAVGHANRLRPDFVVVCGDMLNRDGDAAKVDLARDAERYAAYMKTARTLDKNIPLYHVPGNHDVCNVPTPETLGWYEARFSRPWYNFTHKQCLFIVLESDLLKNPAGAAGAAAWQMRWLRDTLALAEKKTFRHKAAFLHHPPALKSVDEKDQYFNLPARRRKELLGLFEAHGVEAAFSGHYHRNACVRHKKIELVTTSGICHSQGAPAGFRIVKVTPAGIRHTYYGYADMPKGLQ